MTEDKADNSNIDDGFVDIQTKAGLIKTEHRRINISNAEIRSQNHSSLMTAMGAEKFRAYKWGAGLKEAPKMLADGLIPFNLPDTRFSFQEYVDEGILRRHIFIDQELSDGVRLLHVVDADMSEKYVYRLNNLYAIDRQGRVVDILEEVGGETPAYFTPTANAFYDSKGDRLVFGDTSQIEKRLGQRLGVLMHLHEIGHYKDSRLNQNRLKQWIEDKKFDVALMGTVAAVERRLGTLRNSTNKVVNKIVSRAETVGIDILAMEENASNYARVFMVKKREEGIDLSPNLPGRQISNPLYKSFAGYEREALGRVYSHDENTPKYIPRENPAERERFLAQIALVRTLLKTNTPSK